jgi:hypothetical protein
MSGRPNSRNAHRPRPHAAGPASRERALQPSNGLTSEPIGMPVGRRLIPSITRAAAPGLMHRCNNAGKHFGVAVDQGQDGGGARHKTEWGVGAHPCQFWRMTAAPLLNAEPVMEIVRPEIVRLDYEEDLCSRRGGVGLRPQP